MAIEDLKTKQDLERFIGETVEQLPLNTIQGLPTELALTWRADVQVVEVTIPEGAKVSGVVKVAHSLGSVPRHQTFCVLDVPGENTYGFRVVERTDKDLSFVMNAAVAAAAGGLTKNVEVAVYRGGELSG